MLRGILGLGWSSPALWTYQAAPDYLNGKVAIKEAAKPSLTRFDINMPRIYASGSLAAMQTDVNNVGGYRTICCRHGLPTLDGKKIVHARTAFSTAPFWNPDGKRLEVKRGMSTFISRKHLAHIQQKVDLRRLFP